IKTVFEGFLSAYLKYMTKRHLKIDQQDINSRPGPQTGHAYMLYVHIPFCESLCPYCSFNRFILQEKLARAYFQRLRQEMRMVAEQGYRFESMYIGGGTPTVLMDELAETIDLARELFPLREVSCETNPNHLEGERLDALHGRVQRLSVGMQSFNNDLLRQMQRYERLGTGEENLARIRAAAGHFPSLNVDMIYNFPNQSEEMLRADIAAVIASGADQVTFYPLMSAPSVEQSLSRTVGKLDARREPHYYEIIAEEMSRHFVPTSAWTFNRPQAEGGMIDEYIVNYEEYVGIGSGAFSYLDGTLYVNTFSVREYNTHVDEGRLPVAGIRRFAGGDRMRYRFMMELFGLKLDRERFRREFGRPLEWALWKEMLFMGLYGAFRREGSILHLTPRGRYLLVIMMQQFFSGVNYIRDQARNALAVSEPGLFLNETGCKSEIEISKPPALRI
ncbi:MAG TPA: coproporphyrinogen III oxidase family protein, partial [Anaerolineaceae bacterium]|nr:coproporphyrinogen III oxidase family protein [Anaerolineaceae bacterium]